SPFSLIPVKAEGIPNRDGPSPGELGRNNGVNASGSQRGRHHISTQNLKALG
ncbi:hypothetical protein A2U01_0013492, partial [Trifolium medium]|nr:hypothetical protein [Trifolium medium]